MSACNPVSVELGDVSPLDRDKATATLARVTLAEIRDPDSAEFHAAYDLLAGFFFDSGELEDRDALAGFVRQRQLRYGDGLDGTYHLVGAWADGALVGVRDCYVDIDHHAQVSVVALAHTFVVPNWRRTGLAAVLRALPVTIARQVHAERLGGALPTLIVAEMEPADPHDPDTITRLVAYGRSGFQVLDPERVQYAQVEFRDLDGPKHVGMPMLAVVRTHGVVGPEVPVVMVEAFARLFYTCHRMFVPDARVDPCEQHMLRVLVQSPAPVACLPLPESRATLSRLAPFVRGAIVPRYPAVLRGEAPDFGDPAEELAAIMNVDR